MFSSAISELREAAETIWRRVIMAIVKSPLCFTTILHGSFMLSFKKSPFTLEFQKGSRLLATSSTFLVANAQFLVALATSQSQCRTLQIITGWFMSKLLQTYGRTQSYCQVMLQWNFDLKNLYITKSSV